MRKVLHAVLIFIVSHEPMAFLFTESPKPEACWMVGTRSYVRSSDWALGMTRT